MTLRFAAGAGGVELVEAEAVSLAFRFEACDATAGEAVFAEVFAAGDTAFAARFLREHER